MVDRYEFLPDAWGGAPAPHSWGIENATDPFRRATTWHDVMEAASGASPAQIRESPSLNRISAMFPHQTSSDLMQVLNLADAPQTTVTIAERSFTLQVLACDEPIMAVICGPHKMAWSGSLVIPSGVAFEFFVALASIVWRIPRGIITTVIDAFRRAAIVNDDWKQPCALDGLVWKIVAQNIAQQFNVHDVLLKLSNTYKSSYLVCVINRCTRHKIRFGGLSATWCSIDDVTIIMVDDDAAVEHLAETEAVCAKLFVNGWTLQNATRKCQAMIVN
jgi:hypothetical protein